MVSRLLVRINFGLYPTARDIPSLKEERIYLYGCTKVIYRMIKKTGTNKVKEKMMRKEVNPQLLSTNINIVTPTYFWTF